MNLDKLRMVTSSIFLYLIALIFALVLAIQSLKGQTPSVVSIGFVTTILGYAINSQGVQHGVTSTNDTVAKTAIAQYPLSDQHKADALNEPPTLSH